MKKRYECVRDLQDIDWCLGETGTIEWWRKKAIKRVKETMLDGYEQIIEEIEKLPEEKVIDYIANLFKLSFKKVKQCEGKYAELSGTSAVLTTTPYGMLMDILVCTDIEVYLDHLGQYSLDGVCWTKLNRGLYKELVEMSEYMDNIIFEGKEGE